MHIFYPASRNLQFMSHSFSKWDKVFKNIGHNIFFCPTGAYSRITIEAHSLRVFLVSANGWEAGLKPDVCKYPTTVNKSEIYILLPKPYPLMWHLVRRNRVRNCHDRRPETCRRSPKVALLKNLLDSVQYNTEHCGINDDTNDHSV